MQRTVEEQLVCAILRHRPTLIRRGVFLSFWLHIPRAAMRSEQIAHIAVHQSEDGLIGTLIPINFLPVPGSIPPHAADIILPHSITLYLERKLARLGIKRLRGVVSVRSIEAGKPLVSHGYMN